MNRDIFKARLHAYRLAGKITLSAYTVGLGMVKLAGKTGQFSFPEAYIAKISGLRWAKCVQRAKESLAAAGFLNWETRKAKWNRFKPCDYRLLCPPALEQPSETPRQVIVQKKNQSKDRCAVGMSYGSAPKPEADLEAALRRLGAAMGCAWTTVMPWISAGEGGELCHGVPLSNGN